MSPKADTLCQEKEETLLTQRQFSAREWEEIFNAISDPIAIIDKNCNIIKLNKAVLKKFNIRDTQIIGQKCYKIFHSFVDPSVCPCTKLKLDKTGESISQELYDRKSGRTYLIDLHPRYHEDGSIKDLVHIIKDITKIKQAEKNIRKMAITDFLTGVYNQRHFYYKLEKEIDRTMRYNCIFSLILFDVDEFKNFNDKYGHLEGDNILAKVGEIVKQTIRRTDSAYRYGGDEFVILMPQTNKTKATRTAERLLDSFRHSVFITEDQDLVYKTLSIGVTEYQKGDNLKGVIDRVDKAMYKAKRAGGNRICAI
jgi:diguanylate cyclase (GGDEF)-like protein/PAS domain S-box-containing protein